MTRFLASFLSILLANAIYSQKQTELLIDLDNDLINDTVRYDVDSARIICKLSSQNFKPILTESSLVNNFDGSLRQTRNGFTFLESSMHHSSSSQFRYNPKNQKIQLIGMTRSSNRGKSSVNLLTNEYIGEWQCYDYGRDSLIKIPTIKTKMYLKTCYLNEYRGDVQNTYQRKCNALFEKEKNHLIIIKER